MIANGAPASAQPIAFVSSLRARRYFRISAAIACIRRLRVSGVELGDDHHTLPPLVFVALPPVFGPHGDPLVSIFPRPDPMGVPDPVERVVERPNPVHLHSHRAHGRECRLEGRHLDRPASLVRDVHERDEVSIP